LNMMRSSSSAVVEQLILSTRVQAQLLPSH
jgi:hypothetical protein